MATTQPSIPPDLRIRHTRKHLWGYSLLYENSSTHSLHYAETPLPLHKFLFLNKLSPWTHLSSGPHPIPLHLLLPRYSPSTMTPLPPSLSTNPAPFIKPIDYLTCLQDLHFCSPSHPLPASKPIALCSITPSIPLLTREIRTNELLKRNPHPNIATYHGVVVSHTNLVSGLAFKRYDCDLHAYVHRGARFDAEDALAQIAAGIGHLHSLGLVHCDIKPRNIFVDAGGEGKAAFVVGDMDSAHEVGREAELKWGTDWWVERSVGRAVPEMDWYGLGRVRKWLEEKGWGMGVEGGEFESTDVILGRRGKGKKEEGEKENGIKRSHSAISPRSSSSTLSSVPSLLDEACPVEKDARPTSTLSSPPAILAEPHSETQNAHGVKRKYSDVNSSSSLSSTLSLEEP